VKLVLLGSNGQVGAALARAMPAAWQLAALTRADTDLATPGAAAAAIRAHRPDVVINAAAWTAVDRAEAEPEAARRINAEAVAEIAAATGEGVLIHYSTDYVFDGTHAAPYTEADTPRPLNVYGATKLAGEAAAAIAPRHYILRTSSVHASGHGNFATTMLRLAAKRDSLRVVADQLGAPTSAALIAEVTLTALRHVVQGRPPDPGLYHLAARGETSWHGYARYVLGLARDLGHPLRCDPAAVAPILAADYPQPARRPANSRLAVEKLEAALGLTLPPWQEGVRETVTATLALERAA